MPVSLRVLDRCAPLVRALGADPDRTRVVAELRLVLDLHSGSRSGLSLSLTLLALACAFAGLMSVLGLAMGLETYPWVAGLGTLAALLIGLFSFGYLMEMLTNPGESKVLLPLPVSGADLFAARLFHVLQHSLVLSVAYFAPALVLTPILSKSAAPLLYVPALALLVPVTAIAFSALGIAAMLRTIGANRFRTLATWLQICGGLVFVGAYSGWFQDLAGRAADSKLGQGLVDWFTQSLLAAALLPPHHWAGLARLAEGAFEPRFILLGALALATPLVAGVLAVRLTRRGYLDLLNAPAHAARESHRFRPGFWLERIDLGPRRAGAGLAASLGSRDPVFFGKVGNLVVTQVSLACVGVAVVGARVLAMTPESATRVESLLQSLQLSAVALLPALPMTAYLMAQAMTGYGSNPQARWIFEAAPAAEGKAASDGALLVFPFGLAVACSGIAAAVAALFGPAPLVSFLPLSLVAGGAFLLHASGRLPAVQPFAREFRPGVSEPIGFALGLELILKGLLLFGFVFAANLHGGARWIAFAGLLLIYPALLRNLSRERTRSFGRAPR